MKQEYVLKRPLITEKTLAAASFGRYTFEVDSQASKPEISRAVQQAFNVHVLGVKTVNLKGKSRRVGRKRIQVLTSPRTKAVVQLAASEKIDLFTVPGQEEVKPHEVKKEKTEK
ncbi:MAG: 50S ribosomal protein L23 [bacterium]|nr:50S ribosomal protein L23 [bacterium]